MAQRNAELKDIIGLVLLLAVIVWWIASRVIMNLPDTRPNNGTSRDYSRQKQ